MGEPYSFALFMLNLTIVEEVMSTKTHRETQRVCE